MDWLDVALGGHKTRVWIVHALQCMCVTSKTLSASSSEELILRKTDKSKKINASFHQHASSTETWEAMTSLSLRG